MSVDQHQPQICAFYQPHKLHSYPQTTRHGYHLQRPVYESRSCQGTNDLDVDTLRALEEALEEFAGCAVVVSHDRWFLDRIATHIMAFEGDSHVEWFEGNYEAYEADKKYRLGADADRPTRIKYKPLSR